MKIGFSIFWKIEVDDNIDSLNVDTTSEKIRADQIAADAVAEIVEDTITVVL